MSPNCSCASDGCAAGATEPVPASATGLTVSLLFCGGGNGFGGAASFCFVSSEPT